MGLGIVLIVLFAMAPALVAGAANGSEDFDLVIPVDTAVHAPVGSETVLATSPTPAEFVGASCVVTATSENQSSVHPDNDLKVTSGGASVVVPDVEAEPGEVQTSSDTLVLGGQITISLIMGPDHVFSAGIDVGFDCNVDETTTTTTEATTTTSEVGGTDLTTTTLATTTTEATTTTSSDVAGTSVTTTTLPTEVLGTEVLPFTGGDTDLGWFGVTLLASGAMVLVGLRAFSGVSEETRG